MAGPSWLRWVSAAVFLAVAGYCVVRLVAAHRAPASYRGCHRALDVAHLVMGLGMAVMASPIGGPVPAAGWQTAYLLIACWFLGSAWRRWRTGTVVEPIGWHGGGLHHAVAALAMLYMLVAMPGDGHHMSVAWMSPMPPPQAGLFGWIFAGYFVGYAIILGPVALRSVAAPNPIPTVLAAPRVATGCQLIMALGTAYLLAPITWG
jgi:hypothetical protein